MTAATLELRRILRLHPHADWHEDRGPALWWLMPIESPPWAGTPHDSDWPFDGEDEAHLQWSVVPPVWQATSDDAEEGGRASLS